MSEVVSAVIEQSGRTFDLDLDHYVRNYKMVILVQCSDAAYDPYTLFAYDTPIPPPTTGAGPSITLPTVSVTTWPTDAGALCTKVSCAQKQNIYALTYNFTSAPPIPQMWLQDPTDRDPIYSYSFQKQPLSILRDEDNKAILNSAGQPFESPVVINRSLMVVTIKKNYALDGFNINDYLALQDSINSLDWTPAGQEPAEPMTYLACSCYMDNIQISPHYENGISYNEVEYRAIYNPETAAGGGLWFPYQVLDCGYHQIVNIPVFGNQLGRITDAHGGPLQKPALLNGSGVSVGVGGAAAYVTFNIYKKIDWTGIP